MYAKGIIIPDGKPEQRVAKPPGIHDFVNDRIHQRY
jgi:hypothetical protein